MSIGLEQTSAPRDDASVTELPREAQSMDTDETTRKRKRVVPAPAPSSPRVHSTVLDVECAEDEDVEWHWTETVEGRFVSGYSIVRRMADPKH
jgi:hypothetical protein